MRKRAHEENLKHLDYKQLYEVWASEAEQDSKRLIEIARRMTQLCPDEPAAWDALATSIRGLLFPSDRSEPGSSEREQIQKNLLFIEMMEAWNMVLRLNPREANVAWNRAISFDEVGLYEDAAQEFLHAADLVQKFPSEIAPDLGVAFFLAGRCLYSVGKTQQAETALRQALEAGMSDDAETWELLAEVLKKEGKAEEAAVADKKAAELDI